MPLPPLKSRKPGKWNGINRCGGRDITPLQNYANDLNLPRGFLANLLHESEYLEEYQVIPNLNECELTFPNSDWFGVYITDLQGNGKYWFDANGNEVPFVYYFKVIEGPDGYPKINFATATFKKPPELENARPCVIRDGGCYTPGPERKGTRGSPGGSAASSATSTPAKKTKKAAAAASPAAAPVVSIPSDSLQAAMEALQLEPKEAAPVGSKLPRDEAEKLDRKMMIDWMSTNMDPRDVLGCLESGALSAQDQAKIAQLREDIGAGVAPGGGGVEEAAVRAMQVLPSAQTLKMFKAISKKELMAELNAISNMNDRKQGIVQLCQRAGLHYQLDNSKIPKIIGPGGTTVRPEIAMEECARAEARRAHEILAGKVQTAGRYARKIIAGKYPPYTPPAMSGSSVAGPSGVSAPSGQMTPTQANFTGEFIDDLMGLLQNEEFEDFVAAINNTGLVIELREDGIYRDGVYVDTESDEMQDLIDEAALAYIKKYNVAFGRRRGCGKVRKNAKHPMKVSKVRSNFKCAAKKCKKAKGKYQACMRTTLRKMYKRSASFGKKSKSKGGSKVTKIFSKAAKHCKGSKNYRKCMKKTLRKMHKRNSSFGKRLKRSLSRRESKRLTSKRKMNMLSFGKKRKRPTPRNKKMVYKIRTRRIHPKRKSPRMSATSAPVGTVKQGVDGNLWVIKKTKNGVKRWMKK